MNRMFRCVGIAACFTVGAFAASGVSAQAYPAKPIRYLVPYAIGGGVDIVSRIIATRLTERLGQQVVVENRPGAGAIIGTELTAKAPADGYTMLMANIAHGANPSLHRNLPYDTEKAFAPVTLVALLPSILVIHPSLPATSVRDFIALAKARPGQLNYASAGIGSANHLTMELFKVATKTDLVHVAYKGGGPALIDLVGGHVFSIFVTIPPSLPHVRAGRLRALGISGVKRNPSLPDVPTVAEAAVPGFKVYEWQGVVMPAGTPREIITRLNKEIVAVLAIPEVRKRISDLGTEVVGSTPEELAAHIKSELTMWAKVVKQAGIQAE